VADDEGAHARTEEGSVGHEADPDAGGFSGGESAVRVKDEENSQ
jgi:hypothetical protein